MMVRLLRALFPYGPVLFGIGFVAPVVAQLTEAASVTVPGGLTPLQAGLLVGLVWGSAAKVSGRWV